jgi:hypothetical protein
LRDVGVLGVEAVLADSLLGPVDSQVPVPAGCLRQAPDLEAGQVPVMLADSLDKNSNIATGTPGSCVVSEPSAAHQLGQNRFPSDGFTESVGNLVFPSVSSASGRLHPHSVLHSLTPSDPDLGACWMPFVFQFPVTLPTSSTGGQIAEFPHTLSNLSPHSPISSSCPPLSDFSSSFSPTPDLHNPTALQLITRPAKVNPDGLCPSRVISGAARSLKALSASSASSQPLRCLFTDCSFSCGRPLDLTHHRNTMHKFPCLLGCSRSFTTRRRQDQHHQSEGHREPGSVPPHYRCGGCGKTTPSARRDNYRRHLKNCTKQTMAPYVCHCGHPPTSDREEHVRHVDNCKGKAGRPRGSK